MNSQPVGRVARCRSFAEAELVEGTEALLWPAGPDDAADVEELPASSGAVRAVLSWVRPKVLRFETANPEPLPERALVSTVAVEGPARFVAHKSYQIGTTAAYDPPAEVSIVERRDLFRVPVATRVVVGFPDGTLSVYSLDCSVGGLRICPPQPIDIGAEVEVTMDLGSGATVALPAVVRHCEAGFPPSVGLQFVGLTGDLERRLAQFLGHSQRRLMPRVRALVALEYRSHGRPQFVEGLARELSPGDIEMVIYERHSPGDRLELKFRLKRQEFRFQARAVDCEGTGGADGSPLRYVVRVSIDDPGPDVEGRFRKAVRELAIERVGLESR